MKLRSQMENLIDEMLDGQIMLNEAISEFERSNLLSFWPALNKTQIIMKPICI